MFLFLISCARLTNEGDSPLLQLLRAVPDNRASRAYVVYGDPAAWHTSWDVPRIENVGDLEDLDDDERRLWMFVLTNQTIPPPALGVQNLLAEEMGDYYGFDFFGVDRFIYAGNPPDDLTILSGAFDLETIDESLSDLDYDSDELDDSGVLYSLNDDFEINLESPIRTGRLGELNRIVLQEERLFIGRADELVLDGVEALSGERDSLAENEEFAAAAAALADPALSELGQLVGVIFMERDDFAEREMYLDQGHPIAAETEYDTKLPRFELAVFATFHQEGETTLALLLTLDDDEDAAETAEILGDRLRDYVSVVTGQEMDDYWDYGDDLGLTAAGKPVAVVLVEVEDPDLDEASSGPPALFYWSRMLFQLDLFFLVEE